MTTTLLKYCNIERSHSVPELSRAGIDQATKTPNRRRYAHEEFSSKRLKFKMESLMSEDQAKKAMDDAPIWAKLLLEQMSKVNEDVLDMRKQFEVFKIEMCDRVGQVENDVKLTQFKYDTVSMEVGNIRKEIDEVNARKNDLEEQLNKVRESMDDIEQYSKRNCLLFTGIDEPNERNSENTDDVIIDICKDKLGIELNPRSLDRSHRLGRRREPRSSTEKLKPRPIIVKFINYHDRDDVFKSKKKLKGTRISILENLTSQRVSLLNQVREVVGVKNAWSLDGRIFALHKAQKHYINSKEDLAKIR